MSNGDHDIPASLKARTIHLAQASVNALARRIDALEAGGSGGVTLDDGTTEVEGVTRLNVEGGTVTEDGEGEATLVAGDGATVADAPPVAWNGIYRIWITGAPNGGTWKLRLADLEPVEITAAIDHDATAEDVKAALEALPSIGADNVTLVNTGQSVGPLDGGASFMLLVDQTITHDDGEDNDLTGGSSPAVVVGQLQTRSAIAEETTSEIRFDGNARAAYGRLAPSVSYPTGQWVPVGNLRYHDDDTQALISEIRTTTGGVFMYVRDEDGMVSYRLRMTTNAFSVERADPSQFRSGGDDEGQGATSLNVGDSTVGAQFPTGQVAFSANGFTIDVKPEVPASPTEQDIVDALVTLGLVTQAE
jgi:hypothetical protein